jgi:FtsH-binding integral membrane protein
MCVYSVVCYFVGIHLGYTFAFLGALLFVGFIIYDTDKIMKKMVLQKKKKSVSVLHQYHSKNNDKNNDTRCVPQGCDDYVIACIELYMDIINLFIFILDLLGGGRR